MSALGSLAEFQKSSEVSEVDHVSFSIAALSMSICVSVTGVLCLGTVWGAGAGGGGAGLLVCWAILAHDPVPW